jgi:hypothetical protein
MLRSSDLFATHFFECRFQLVWGSIHNSSRAILEMLWAASKCIDGRTPETEPRTLGRGGCTTSGGSSPEGNTTSETSSASSTSRSMEAEKRDLAKTSHGNAGVWKAWKAMKPAFHPSHTPWKSLRGFPHYHGYDGD